jgi:hypothetical protein
MGCRIHKSRQKNDGHGSSEREISTCFASLKRPAQAIFTESYRKNPIASTLARPSSRRNHDLCPSQIYASNGRYFICEESLAVAYKECVSNMNSNFKHQMNFATIAVALFLCAGMAALASCGGTANPNTIDSTLGFSSTGTTTTSPTPSSSGFYVHVQATSSPTIETLMHKFNSYGSDCIITQGSSPSDIRCLVSIREEDLYFNGLTLNINVPAGMCNYLQEYPYWYYNFEPGYGASSIYIDQVNGGCSVDSKYYYNITGQSNTAHTSYSNGTCTVTNASGQTIVSATSSSSTCPYNYTLNTPAGPNCCGGSYTITTLTSSGTSTTTASYGGNPFACADGPTQANSWPKVNNEPIPVQTSVLTSGLNKTYTIAAPIQEKQGNGLNNLDVYGANFYAWTTYKGMGTTYNAATYNAATIPKAIKPSTDREGNTLVAGNESYTYLCLDQAAAIKHRIRVYILKWDSADQYALYKGSSGTSGTPTNVNGQGINSVEGTDCDVGSALTGPCDSYYSWDDVDSATYQALTGASYFPSENAKTSN